MNDWTLYLKSVVCHKGSSPYSGHYISYARAEEEWIKLDDMNKEMRVTLVKDQAKMFADLAENAYILFYELDKTCQHHNDNNSHISNSSAIIRKGATKGSSSPSLFLHFDVKE
ncbi:hypothetical protein RMCBS344292_13845 [Rhizopus microsporus]|nr:hypothetical protein RMCBS344292_13845 [Rhizopus microsporus]